MALVERFTRFFREDVWRMRRKQLSIWHRMVVDVARVTTITVEGFANDLCSTRAAALTFTSLLALVPVLALSLAVLRGLGWEGARLETLILEKVTLLSPEAIAAIVSYVDRVNFTGLGVIGGAFILVTFVSVVTSVETAFNAIWDGASPRTVARRISDYFGVMVVAPVLVVVAMSLTAAMRSNQAFLWLKHAWGIGAAFEWTLRCAAWPVVWLLFGFLYLFVPNTRVRVGAAVIGAMAAGTVWQLTQWAYIRFQFGVANYNAVYGALAQLPLLMAWVYASWSIVLFGCELAHAVQVTPVHGRERRASAHANHAFHEWVGVSVAVELARAALERTQPPTAQSLAQLFDVPVRTVRGALTSLEGAGLAHATPVDEAWYLSRAPEAVSVVRVLDALHGSVPTPNSHSADSTAGRLARGVLADMRGEAERVFAERTLREVALSEQSRAREGGSENA